MDANGDGKADPWDIEDAIYSAAKYLAANGAAEGNFRDAVFAYNHADWYVEEVMGLRINTLMVMLRSIQIVMEIQVLQSWM